MKKFFTLIATALLAFNLNASAQTEGVVELSWDTMDKNEAGDNASDQAAITFNNKDGFVLKPEGGRTQAKTERESCAKVLNFKNNTNQTLVIPEGTKVYKINFYGWSQGDNWTYLYAYGPETGAWEWTDPIGTGIKDNAVIIEQAKYPLDPCVVGEAYAATSPAYHNAGYCFASLDFSDEPYEGQFCFVFSGNNQERVWMEIYTTKEAAAAAPKAEDVKLGKDKSQTTFIDAAAAEAEKLKPVELSWDTMDKNDTGDNAFDQASITFNNNDGFILKPDGGRTQAKTEREYCGKVLNFKNNANQTLIIPQGTKVYKINFYGWSQGDNWTYLYAYGPETSAWEWTDPIGTGIKDNAVIIEQAKYPLDPCVVGEAYAATSPVYHNAGYCFASLDFSDEPYEGQFCFVFNGNNQERAWMEVYTTPEGAAAAPGAEDVKLGKDKSQTIYIDAAATGIENVTVQKPVENGAIYNLSGMRVGKDYKGIVIIIGKKYLNK